MYVEVGVVGVIGRLGSGWLLYDGGSDVGGVGAVRGVMDGSLGELAPPVAGPGRGPGGGGAATDFYSTYSHMFIHHPIVTR